jgi:hypothetical protein
MQLNALFTWDLQLAWGGWPHDTGNSKAIVGEIWGK